MAGRLVCTRGLPGSGKTTWAVQTVSARLAEGVRAARVNRDEVRDMLHRGAYSGPVTERAVTFTQHATIAALLAEDYLVISDDTNLRQRHLRDLAGLATAAGAAFEVVDLTGVPLLTCLARDLARPPESQIGQRSGAQVGADVIHDLHRRYLAGPRPALDLSVPERPAPRRYEPPPGGLDAVMVDVDGTVALMDGRSPYDEGLVHQDRPNQPVVDLVRTMWSEGVRVVFMSGRSEGCRADTEDWLRRNVGVGYELHMRPVGDARQDALVKAEMFDTHVRDRYRVRFVLDDRDQVVQMWRSLGLPVFQVADGNF